MRGFKTFVAALGCLLLAVPATAFAQVENPQSGAVGMQGTISQPPPTRGATISVPSSGQSFSQIPITVSGLCPGDLLVKIFKNNVFAGSAQCRNGSYSVILDLFTGANELVARVYDALDQPGPDSNTVSVTFVDARANVTTRPTLTSNFAKRGVNPKQELVWPIVLSGGSGPYAISVDWGDGKPPDLMSLGFPGPFNIKHAYDSAGVYNVVVKAVDRDGGTAFLQLVAVANGPLSQDQGQNKEEDKTGETKTVILWQPAAILIPMMLSTFWLGRKYELKYLKKKIERGERPF
ncbi:MAG TPA: hypothetical protein VK694_03225 [Verrucomicrobiae bacterium]|nr:hypothetical protein [Verrucomicrobiae bacterium]